ncbi:MAG: TVP38/TMEM64 family protein [Desulfobulbaceae bacterium]|nr:TVP38/TMEM64 family protein [Desulfobulbaceae bacterium]HIJ89692.1 TVP38/TMEM64 family protein [Deltaproteobacteria bacterium]
MTRFLKNRIFYLLLILVGIAAVTLYAYQQDNLFIKVLHYLQNSRQHGEEIRAAILAKGAFAPLIFITLQVLQVVIAPIPGEASGVFGGYLFGALPALLYSSVGLTIGSWLAFMIGRLLSDLVRRRLEHTAIYQRFNHLVSKGDFIIPFVLFLLPGFPKDSLAYLLGMSHMPMPVFLFITVVGRIPGTLLLSLQGAEIYQGNYLKFVLLLAISALIALPYALYHKRILAWLTHYSRRTFPNNGPNNPAPPETK